MTLDAEIAALRRHLGQLAREAEPGLLRRYTLKFSPTQPPGLYRRFRVAVGRALRAVGLRSPQVLEPWLPGLQQVVRSQEASPLVIWALGTDRETLRAACRGFERLQADLPDRAFVLVTDLADFAFFSRLGWLVEYVPALSAPAGAYAGRKERYLAWRYRDAPALPVSAGLQEGVDVMELAIDE